ncbi:Hypothetical predicted protein, partial [Paramuricea clavata]
MATRRVMANSDIIPPLLDKSRKEIVNSSTIGIDFLGKDGNLIRDGCVKFCQTRDGVMKSSCKQVQALSKNSELQWDLIAQNILESEPTPISRPANQVDAASQIKEIDRLRSELSIEKARSEKLESRLSLFVKERSLEIEKLNLTIVSLENKNASTFAAPMNNNNNN